MFEQRLSYRVPLDIYLNKFIRGVPYMSRSRDISRDGIFLNQLLEPVNEGERIGVQFQLPGTNEVIYAEGHIVRERQKAGRVGHGIRFTLITDYHRRLIDRFIRRSANAAAA